MKKLLLPLVLLSLSGCSIFDKNDTALTVQKTKIIEHEIVHPILPNPVTPPEPKFRIITKYNINDSFKESPYLIAMTKEEFIEFAKFHLELSEYLKNIKSVVCFYHEQSGKKCISDK